MRSLTQPFLLRNWGWSQVCPLASGKEQGTAKALRPVAIGVRKLEAGVHAQSFGTQGHAITVALAVGMAMLVERNGGHAPAMGHGLIGVPGIEGGIGGDVGGEEAQGGDRADVEREEVGDVVLVERLGELGQDHIAIAGNGRAGDARTVAPEVFLFLGGGAIGLLLVGGAFDAQRAIGVACELLIFLEALFDVGTRVVLFDVGVDVGDIEGHGFAQARDFLTQSLDGGDEQGLQHGLREGTLFLGEPASRGHGALDIKAVGLAAIEHGTKAQLEHEEGMLHQVAAQLGTMLEPFLDFEQQCLDIGAVGMGTLARLGRLKQRLRYRAPIEEGEEAAEALDNWVIGLHERQGVLVKDARIWYHGSKLLEGQ